MIENQDFLGELDKCLHEHAADKENTRIFMPLIKNAPDYSLADIVGEKNLSRDTQYVQENFDRSFTDMSMFGTFTKSPDSKVEEQAYHEKITITPFTVGQDTFLDNMNSIKEEIAAAMSVDIVQEIDKQILNSMMATAPAPIHIRYEDMVTSPHSYNYSIMTTQADQPIQRLEKENEELKAENEELRAKLANLEMEKLQESRPKSMLDRVNVSRLKLFIENNIKRIANDFIFEPNDSTTRTQVKYNIENFLQEVLERRGITKFMVVCNEINNSTESINNGQLNIDVIVTTASSTTAIEIPVSIKPTPTSFDELLSDVENFQRMIVKDFMIPKKYMVDSNPEQLKFKVVKSRMDVKPRKLAANWRTESGQDILAWSGDLEEKLTTRFLESAYDDAMELV